MSKSKTAYLLLLFILIFSLSIISIVHNKQLGMADGAAEEYFSLGWNLHHMGRFFPNNDNIPFVFRPPGYPAFIAAVLNISGIPKMDRSASGVQNDFSLIYRSFSAIFFAQSVLLGLSAVFLFLILCRFLSNGFSFILAFLFGINPHLLVLAGFIRYDILHVFFTVFACYMTIISIEKLFKHPYIILFAGLSWGLTSLVRPMTLILPPFILVTLFIIFKKQWGLILKGISFFCLGMILAVGPYTARNFFLTGKFIPVNEQAAFVFWASTVAKLPPIKGPKRWNTIGKEYDQPIWEEVTKTKTYNYYVLIKNNLKLNNKHKELAYKNLKHQPSVYLYNALQHFYYFNFGYTSNYIEMFLNKNKLNIAAVQKNLPRSTRKKLYADVFSFYMHVMIILSLMGLFLGIFKRGLRHFKNNEQQSTGETSDEGKTIVLYVSFLIYLCFCTAHTISYMDYMYYYIKLPFLYIFLGLFISSLPKYLSKSHPLLSKINVSAILTGILFCFSATITFMIVFF